MTLYYFKKEKVHMRIQYFFFDIKEMISIVSKFWLLHFAIPVKENAFGNPKSDLKRSLLRFLSAGNKYWLIF